MTLGQLDRLPAHRVMPYKTDGRAAAKKAWTARLSGKSASAASATVGARPPARPPTAATVGMSTKAAAQIIAEYERAIKSDDAPALPCVSPETSAKLETAGSCAAATSYRGFVVGRAASRFLWLAVCIAYAFVRKIVVAVLCIAKGALVTARVSAQAARAAAYVAECARSGFVAASTASFVVAGLALEYGIRLYGAIRVRAEPFLRARAPEACKFLFPTSPKKDVDLEEAVESVAVSPKSDSPTKRTPKTPAPQPRWVKTPSAEDQ